MIISIFTEDFNKKQKEIERISVKFVDFKKEKVINKHLEFLPAMLSVSDLFGINTVAFIHNSMENPNTLEWITKNILEMKNSTNVFVFVESVFKKDDGYSKVKEHSKEFIESKSKENSAQQIFGLATAMERKDKKLCWLILNELKQNSTIESIIPILKWKILQMLKAHKPEVKNVFSKEDLAKMLKELVFIFHGVHNGEYDEVDSFDPLESFFIKNL